MSPVLPGGTFWTLGTGEGGQGEHDNLTELRQKLPIISQNPQITNYQRKKKIKESDCTETLPLTKKQKQKTLLIHVSTYIFTYFALR